MAGGWMNPVQDERWKGRLQPIGLDGKAGRSHVTRGRETQKDGHYSRGLLRGILTLGGHGAHLIEEAGVLSMHLGGGQSSVTMAQSQGSLAAGARQRLTVCSRFSHRVLAAARPSGLGWLQER